MKCDDFRERVSFFIDNEMDRKEREGWESHLKRCEACKGLLDELSAVDSLIAGLPDPAPPSIIPGDLIARGKRHQSPGWVRLAGAFTVMIIVILGTVFFLQRPDWNPSNFYTPIDFRELGERPAADYHIELNESNYNLKLWGEEVKLLSCEIRISDGNTQAELSVDFEAKKCD